MPFLGFAGVQSQHAACQPAVDVSHRHREVSAAQPSTVPIEPTRPCCIPSPLPQYWTCLPPPRPPTPCPINLRLSNLSHVTHTLRLVLLNLCDHRPQPHDRQMCRPGTGPFFVLSWGTPSCPYTVPPPSPHLDPSTFLGHNLG